MELEGNERQYYRLVAKLFSMDEAFNKMAQSFANASAIISLAQTWKSLARNIYRACEETWKVSPMALDKVQDFQPLMEISANFLSVLKADRRSRRAGRSESQLLAKFNSQ